MYGKRIRQARKEKGLTQRQLAEKVYVHQNMISAYECGTIIPPFTTVIAIAKVLNVSLDWLAGGPE